MAYRQHNDPYYNSANQNHYYHTDHSPATGAHAYSTDMPLAGNYANNNNDYDAHWDSKSTKSSHTYHSGYADSQAHLNPQYEMSEVAPPLPSVGYAFQPSYPPVHQLRPPLREQSTGGWSSARDKLMKRRSVRQVELYQGNLVLDVAVPSHIAPAGASEEMKMMRYTAATCDPE